MSTCSSACYGTAPAPPLEASFGADAVHAAGRRVRRRPQWRGGHPRPSPLYVYLLAKRAMELAAQTAADRGDAGIGPQHQPAAAGAAWTAVSLG